MPLCVYRTLRYLGFEMSSNYVSILEEAKRGSVLQLLFRASRLLNERGVSRARVLMGEDGIREVHMRMFAYIELEGTRLTTLAGHLGVSKQAVGQWVDELVAMGMLERIPDPSDGRARLIRFSAQGREWLLDGLSLLKRMEEDLASVIGQDEIDALHRILGKLLAHLEGDEC